MNKLITKIGNKEIHENTKISLVANPKRPGGKAYDRYSVYENASTVREYLKLGGTRADLAYDCEKEFVKFL